MISNDEIRWLMRLLDLNQGELAEMIDVSQPTVSRWLRGQRPEREHEKKLLEMLAQQEAYFDRLREEDLISEESQELSLHKEKNTAESVAVKSKIDSKFNPQFKNFVEAPTALEFDKGLFLRDVPTLGITACGDDASFILNGQTGDYVRRPPGIAGKRSVYALNVFGESMYPVYRHNALVYVDPNKTPAVTEDGVIELHPEDLNSGEPGKGFLKRFKGYRNGKIVCEQFNPPEEVEFDRSDVKSFHRVIPLDELLGY